MCVGDRLRHQQRVRQVRSNQSRLKIGARRGSPQSVRTLTRMPRVPRNNTRATTSLSEASPVVLPLTETTHSPRPRCSASCVLSCSSPTMPRFSAVSFHVTGNQPSADARRTVVTRFLKRRSRDRSRVVQRSVHMNLTSTVKSYRPSQRRVNSTSAYVDIVTLSLCKVPTPS